MTTENNSPTRSTDNAHAGQPSDDNYPYYTPRQLPVCPYSRKRALAAGLQMEVSREYLEFLHRDWDMLLPERVFLTKKVVECWQISDTPVGQNEKGQLFLILNAVDAVIGNSPENPTSFQVRSGPAMYGPFVELLTFWSTADVDDPTPVVTVMFAEEL